MGLLDDVKGKVDDLVSQNPDKVEELSDQGIAKATEVADSASGGKFGEQIDAAGQKVDEAIGE